MSDSDHEAVTLRPGEHWQLRLPALGAAGYTWTWRTEGDAGAVKIDQGRPPAEELEGRPFGTSADALFTVTAVRPGRIALQLEHHRVWEQDKPPIERRRYDIVVT
ncbi:protease inhibitor I42 family protein [Streptomyces sp. NPDC085900]|uniref:protease inhibitor I42 family protein n=1 Tax=Streptomyces sp. NPDC085900 TaxID=3365737 RepID=UPI0037D6BCEC